ncbi:unnamed protein product [Trypanosoma congolense IL3000]|uniref:WGS project CAEQ00000000 data, annotated contig 159 n=1 Tax=Trypanosoma congolense (strain IL3000) TaxID=1068625 RepID=F9W7A6_TRYCI|nr:unnamed protein product [Trypanosoma congolense IL3000]
MPKRLAWSPEGDEHDSWLPERACPKSRKEEAAPLPEDDEWMVAIRMRQPPRNPSWTMRSTIREVLLEGMRDPNHLNLFDFLQLYYRDVPENVARFTVGDFLRDPRRCMKDKNRRKDIGMSMSQMRSRLRERLLHVSYDLFSYHIQTLGDWAKKGRSERVEAIARSLLDGDLKQAQEHDQAEERVQEEEPVQRKPRGSRQGPVFLPSSSSSASVSSVSSRPRRESSPSSDVEFLVESPPPPKKEENSSPHGTQPAPGRKRRVSASMESLREASPPMPQEVHPSRTPPTRQPSQESYSDVEFLGANPPPSRIF